MDLNSTQNLVHPEWEMIDPTPDIFSLFGTFDQKFFYGKLCCVELEWSKKMYSCAGICYQRKNALGKSCVIRLSEPLLKLRTRKNLIETLLHEMIHAYLFIINIREANGGHGPNFCRIMTSINKVAGTNITVYHSYYDEVNLYKTHVWRCNGICQHRKPFFGYVRRTNNRAPGPADNWWSQHKEMCGGYFQKISAPEPKRKSKFGTKENGKNSTKAGATIDSPKWGFVRGNLVSNGATKVITSNSTKTMPTNSARIVTPTRNTNTGNLINVVGFRDLINSSPPVQATVIRPSDAGHKLGQTNTTKSSKPTANVAQNLRELWNKKYPNTSVPQSEKRESSDNQVESLSKRQKFQVENATSQWESIDDDIQIENVQPTTIVLDETITETPPRDKKQLSDERSRNIRKEILESMNADNDSDIELIDDEFDDAMIEIVNTVSDTSIVDDLFGEDTLMKGFKEINDVIMKDPENVGRSNREIITCPICQERMAREELDEHLDGCLGIRINVSATSRSAAFPSTSRATITITTGRKPVITSAVESEYNQRILNEMNEERLMRRESAEPIEIVGTYPCPVCTKEIEANEINNHLDLCLLSSS